MKIIYILRFWTIIFELSGREPWSSGYRRRLVLHWSWVWVPAPYTGWTFVMCVWKDENKLKEAGDGPFLINDLSRMHMLNTWEILVTQACWNGPNEWSSYVRRLWLPSFTKASTVESCCVSGSHSILLIFKNGLF